MSASTGLWRPSTRPDIPLILSGGLTPDNVAEAISGARPFAVDVASGVEAAPGHKDPEKLNRLFESVGRDAAPFTPDGGHRSSCVEGRFGRYGGRYVPETLMPALAELERGMGRG